MMEADQGSGTPLMSIYADDETISEILPVFLSNIPKYVGDLRTCLERRDWQGAARVCHDLKGTAGGYGYPDIGVAAQQLEVELKGSQEAPALGRYFHQIETLAMRARMALSHELRS